MITKSVKNLILNACKASGPDVKKLMSYIEEQLTGNQATEVKRFLTWSFTNKRYFGHGNFETRLQEFKNQGA